MNTKLFVLLCIVVTQTYSVRLDQHSRERISKVHEECQADPATRIDGKMDEVHEAGDSAIFKAHGLCMYKKLGLVDDNGQVNKEELRTVLDKFVKDASKLDHLVTECSAQRENAEETALHVFHCISGAAESAHLHEVLTRWEEIHEECQSKPEIKISGHMAEEFKANGNTPILRAHAVCMYQKQGLIKENGDVDEEKFKSVASAFVRDHAKVNEIVTRCGAKQGSIGETALSIFHCTEAEMNKGRAERAHHDEVVKRWHEIHEECQAKPELKISGHMPEAFKASGDTPLFRAHAVCMYQKEGLLKENGDIDEDKYKFVVSAYVPDHDHVNEIVSKCAVKKESIGETALGIFKCNEEMKKLHATHHHRHVGPKHDH